MLQYRTQKDASADLFTSTLDMIEKFNNAGLSDKIEMAMRNEVVTIEDEIAERAREAVKVVSEREGVSHEEAIFEHYEDVFQADFGGASAEDAPLFGHAIQVAALCIGMLCHRGCPRGLLAPSAIILQDLGRGVKRGFARPARGWRIRLRAEFARS